jgi:hypothetical protein
MLCVILLRHYVNKPSPKNGRTNGSR